MTTQRSSGSRRTVLAASLAATAGLVGGMALETVGPPASPSSASTSVTDATTPSVDDQSSTGVARDDDDRYDDSDDDSDDDSSAGVFQPAVPSSGANVGGGDGPVLSSHGS